MGWLSVSASANRQNNLNSLANETVTIARAQGVIDSVSKFTDAEIEKAQNLMQQACSQQGTRYSNGGVVKTAEQLATQLNRAVRDCQQFKDVAVANAAELEQLSEFVSLITAEYNLVRTDRTLRLSPSQDVPPSGREMVRLAQISRADTLDRVEASLLTSARFLEQAVNDADEAKAFLEGTRVPHADIRSVIRECWISQTRFGR